jgi:putative FmdB family regulatory protein
MPTYEYQCNACGHEFERVQRITEDPVKTCPQCKKRKVERLISLTSFVLKGGGWYNDLYASKKADSGKDGSEKTATPDAKSDADKSPTADSKDAADKGPKPDSKKGSKDKSSSKGGKKSKGSKAAA